jgi:hypothetical protein
MHPEDSSDIVTELKNTCKIREVMHMHPREEIPFFPSSVFVQEKKAVYYLTP